MTVMYYTRARCAKGDVINFRSYNIIYLLKYYNMFGYMHVFCGKRDFGN